MIHTGDAVEVMRGMPSDSVDAVVTDPPYHLSFMGKEWDRVRAQQLDALVERHPDREGKSVSPFYRPGWGNSEHRASAQESQAWHEAWGREALRVTKPGGYLLAFGGTRTHHRLVCGLEDAGWIIRDELTWIYASGFPKGKANLKPAHEPIVLARKPGPLRPLAIDACRIGTDNNGAARSNTPGAHRPGRLESGAIGRTNVGAPVNPSVGRWPSNLLLSDPELFDEPNPGIVGSGATSITGGDGRAVQTATAAFGGGSHDGNGYADSGGYSRFFIVPKSDRRDREPALKAVYCTCETVKPDRWLEPDPSQPAQTASTSRRRGIFEAGTTADSDLSTMQSGSSTSDPSPQDTRSTTSTGTSSTTESRTSSPSIPSPTSGSTPAARSSTASGGSDAPSAAPTGSSPRSGGISPRKAGRSTADADPATSPASSMTSVCADCGGALKPSNGGPVEAGDGVAGARRNSHPT
jgi:hypothetical protein